MSLTFREAPRDLASIVALEQSLELPSFTAEDAWRLGSTLRARLLPHPTPVVINIALANANQILFQSVTKSGATPDNDLWIARKRKTVLRFGQSSWYMHVKMAGDEQAFQRKYMLGDEAGSYAIHGGGVPIRVRNVEGIVAVLVVSGLKQDQDMMVAVEALEHLKQQQQQQQQQ